MTPAEMVCGMHRRTDREYGRVRYTPVQVRLTLFGIPEPRRRPWLGAEVNCKLNPYT